jgi:hypothetical protein
MAEPEVLHCAACSLEIILQEGHYRLADRRYHPRCYDREGMPDQATSALWVRLLKFTSFGSDIARVPDSKRNTSSPRRE